MTGDHGRAPLQDTDGGWSGEAPNGASSPGHFAPSQKRLSLRSPRAALEPERVPEPKRASARARHPVVIAGSAIFTLVFLLAIASGFAVIVGKQQLDAPGPLAQSQLVNIPRSLGTRDIADLLQREGVIDQKWVFLGGVALKGWGKLKSGEYEFKKQASAHDVIDMLVEGRVFQHHLTIPEGLTSDQVVQRLLENDVLAGDIKQMPAEGTILPDTYSFPRGASRDQLIQHMQQEQRRVVHEIWNRRSPDLPLRSPEQLVVLASLIEKETGKPDERTRIAAVFINRLKLKMRLQSDPTIIYGLVGGKGTLGRPILRSEIEQPTPYNTYVIDGLPPGPIANPGRAALEAAANPARTKELYFVADGTGGHAFAETLDQHQKSVARLRQLEQQQKDSTQSAPSAAALAPAPPLPAVRQSPPAPARNAPHGRPTQDPKSAPARSGEAQSGSQ